MSRRDAAWLMSQRWFRAKQRPIATVNEIDRATIAARGALTVLEVGYDDGSSSDRYLVPLMDDHEPADGEGVWRALAEIMTEGGELPSSHGRFTAEPGDRAGGVMTLDERRLRVEQSNTSVALGEQLMLKLYRLLEGGDKPDIEVSTFLTRSGFADTPAVRGALEYVDSAGSRSAAAMLQTFVVSRGDAWAAVLDALGADPGGASYIASQLGDLTRRMHDALASRPDDARFPARAATPDDVAEWRASAEHQLDGALSAVSGHDRERLVQLTSTIARRFSDTFEGAGGSARVSRIHGDYHLGQLLARVDGGFTVIDFEGEPARPLSERRMPSSPLRDVAGMLRSLDYAARTAVAGAHVEGFDPDMWLERARREFLDAYGGIGDEEQVLLDAFELEKACYEIRYEANNRPDWLWLPLAAVERLAAR